VKGWRAEAEKPLNVLASLGRLDKEQQGGAGLELEARSKRRVYFLNFLIG